MRWKDESCDEKRKKLIYTHCTAWRIFLLLRKNHTPYLSSARSAFSFTLFLLSVRLFALQALRRYTGCGILCASRWAVKKSVFRLLFSVCCHYYFFPLFFSINERRYNLFTRERNRCAISCKKQVKMCVCDVHRLYIDSVYNCTELLFCNL